MEIVDHRNVANGVMARLKHFFGVFILLPFEFRLLNELMNHLPYNCQIVLKKQFLKLNRVDRVLISNDINLSFCHTSFYRMKFGSNKRYDIDPKFNHCGKYITIARAFCQYLDRKLEVKYIVVEGVFFCMEYRSVSDIDILMKNFTIEKFDVIDSNFTCPTLCTVASQNTVSP